jgi:hypothetical protein
MEHEKTEKPTKTTPPNGDLSPQEIAELVLAEQDLVIDPVPTPEWPSVDGQIYVRTLRGIERETYLKSIRRVTGSGRKQVVDIEIQDSTAKLAALAMCDRHGHALFSLTHVAALGQKSSRALDRVVKAAAKLNGLDDDAEEAAKNASAETPASDSSIGSRTH